MRKIVFLALAVFIATTAVAAASVSDKGRRLAGPFCVGKANAAPLVVGGITVPRAGVVRSVAYKQSCRTWEVPKTGLAIPVQVGPKGDKGDKGATGSQGAPGPQGAAGANGTDGKDGKDGVSPTLTVTQNENNCVTITATDVNGTTSGQVCGIKGDTGATGAPGQDGKDGKDGKDCNKGNGGDGGNGDDKPGNGYGDDNHTHTGPPGQNGK